MEGIDEHALVQVALAGGRVKAGGGSGGGCRGRFDAEVYLFSIYQDFSGMLEVDCYPCCSDGLHLAQAPLRLGWVADDLARLVGCVMAGHWRLLGGPPA